MTIKKKTGHDVTYLHRIKYELSWEKKFTFQKMECHILRQSNPNASAFLFFVSLANFKTISVVISRLRIFCCLNTMSILGAPEIDIISMVNKLT